MKSVLLSAPDYKANRTAALNAKTVPLDAIYKGRHRLT